jgi:hypothetical protein
LECSRCGLDNGLHGIMYRVYKASILRERADSIVGDEHPGKSYFADTQMGNAWFQVVRLDSLAPLIREIPAAARALLDETPIPVSDGST